MISMEENSGGNQGAFGGEEVGPLTSTSQNPPPTNLQVSGVSHILETNVMGTVNSGGRSRSKIFIWLILAFILLLIMALAAYFLGSGQTPKLPIPNISKTQDGSGPTPSDQNVVPTSTPQVVEGIEGWLEYKKGGQFSFKYPPEAETKEYDDGSFAVTQWGPTQKEGTEFYDGVSMSFRAFDPEGKTLKETADVRYLELKDVFETTQPVVTSVAQVSGYTFRVRGFVDADYYYVVINPTLYLEVINATKDPTDAGFTETAGKILMTLVLNP